MLEKEELRSYEYELSKKNQNELIKIKKGLQDIDCLLYYKNISDSSLNEPSVQGEIVQQLKKFLKSG